MKKKPLAYGEKQERVLNWLKKSPNDRDKTIAMAVGCHVSYVRHLRAQLVSQAADAYDEAAEVTGATLMAAVDPVMMAQVEDEITSILNERGSRYGNFMGHAEITIGLKRILHNKIAQRDMHLYPDQIEALDMICHKLGRIVNGDPQYADSWIDIAGYAKLVADRLEGKSR